MLNLQWITCGDDHHWCNLMTVKLANVTANGVYIIWHGGNPSKVVRVGQGDIAARLAAHRKDAAILKYEPKGLFVTWAAVPAAQQDGVERYLADQWSPLVGDAFPDVHPIAVNSPFG